MEVVENAALAQKLRELYDFLVIAGYEEGHATRYLKIARYIEKMPESAEVMMREHRLTEIPGVGKLVAQYMREIIQDGKSSKQTEWEATAPYSVIEMTTVPGLGAKTARRLFAEKGITSLAGLKQALEAGHLDDFSGLGPKLRQAIVDS